MTSATSPLAEDDYDLDTISVRAIDISEIHGMLVEVQIHQKRRIELRSECNTFAMKTFVHEPLLRQQFSREMETFSRVREPATSFIQLLCLHPLGHPSTKIHGHLCPVSLTVAQTMPYAALSYTCADYGPSCEISLNGQDFRVPQKLETLLRILAWDVSQGCRYLWIEAICIDQSNASERASQLSTVSEIYFHAAQILVWLDHIPGIDDWIQALNHLGSPRQDQSVFLRQPSRPVFHQGGHFTDHGEDLTMDQPMKQLVCHSAHQEGHFMDYKVILQETRPGGETSGHSTDLEGHFMDQKGYSVHPQNLSMVPKRFTTTPTGCPRDLEDFSTDFEGSPIDPEDFFMDPKGSPTGKYHLTGPKELSTDSTEATDLNHCPIHFKGYSMGPESYHSDSKGYFTDHSINIQMEMPETLGRNTHFLMPGHYRICSCQRIPDNEKHTSHVIKQQICRQHVYQYVPYQNHPPERSLSLIQISISEALEEMSRLLGEVCVETHNVLAENDHMAAVTSDRMSLDACKKYTMQNLVPHNSKDLRHRLCTIFGPSWRSCSSFIRTGPRALSGLNIDIVARWHRRCQGSLELSHKGLKCTGLGEFALNCWRKLRISTALEIANGTISPSDVEKTASTISIWWSLQLKSWNEVHVSISKDEKLTHALVRNLDISSRTQDSPSLEMLHTLLPCDTIQRHFALRCACCASSSFRSLTPLELLAASTTKILRDDPDWAEVVGGQSNPDVLMTLCREFLEIDLDGFVKFKDSRIGDYFSKQSVWFLKDAHHFMAAVCLKQIEMMGPQLLLKPWHEFDSLAARYPLHNYTVTFWNCHYAIAETSAEGLASHLQTLLEEAWIASRRREEAHERFPTFGFQTSVNSQDLFSESLYLGYEFSKKYKFETLKGLYERMGACMQSPEPGPWSTDEQFEGFDHWYSPHNSPNASPITHTQTNDFPDWHLVDSRDYSSDSLC